MSDRLKQHQDERSELVKSMRNTLDRCADEKRDLTDEEESKMGEQEKRLAEIDAVIEHETVMQKREQVLARRRTLIEMQTGVPMMQQIDLRSRWEHATRDYLLNGREMTDESRQVFRDVRGLHEKLGSEVRADQSVGTPAKGGYLTHPEFSDELAVAMKEYSAVERVARVVPTATGSDMPWPTLDDTGQGAEIIDEGASHNQIDLTFDQVTLKAWLYSSGYITVSWQLLQDSLIDIVGIIRDAMAPRFGRTHNAHFTTGNGTTQPAGFVGSSAVVGAAGATAITYPDLVDLEHGIDPAYRANAVFMANDTILATVRKLTDAVGGRPLWEPSLQAAAPDRLFGYPVLRNPDMDAAPPAADEESMAFGNFQRYVIRRVSAVRLLRLEEVGALNGQVIFIAYMRADGRPVFADSGVGVAPIAVLQH